MAKPRNTTNLSKSERKCSVEDCSTVVYARGYCARCYRRLLWQGRLELVIARKGSTEAFLRKHAEIRTDKCILWPFGKNPKGYGVCSVAGVKMAASRAMCILAHGGPPFPKAEAAHSCNVVACVNPGHLRWATAKENAADKKRAGTQPIGETAGAAKLTAESVLLILHDERPHELIAGAFQISRTTVTGIKRGAVWNSVTGLPNRRRLKSGGPRKALGVPLI
jgi:hypothetical protein